MSETDNLAKIPVATHQVEGEDKTCLLAHVLLQQVATLSSTKPLEIFQGDSFAFGVGTVDAEGASAGKIRIEIKWES